MQQDGTRSTKYKSESSTPVKKQRDNSKVNETKERLAKIYAFLANQKPKNEMSFSEDKEAEKPTNKFESNTTDSSSKKKLVIGDPVLDFASPKGAASTKSLQSPDRKFFSSRTKPESRVLYSESKNRNNSRDFSSQSSRRTSQGRKIMIDAFGTEHHLTRSVSKSPISSKVKHDIKERERLTSLSRLQGSQKFESNKMRKEMENQMKILETRLKKLAKEHEKLQKDIEKSEKIETRAIEYKTAKTEEIKKLADDRLKKKLQEDEKHEKVKSQRRENISKIKESMAVNRAKISELVNDLNRKMEQKKEEMREKEELEKIESKRKEIYENHKKSRLTKEIIEETKTLEAGLNHSKFLEEQKKTMENLNSKISGLIKMEEVMIDKIKSTQNVKINIENKIKKILLSDIEISAGSKS